MVSEKSNTLQDQIDELTTNNNNEFLRINEKIELNNSEYGDKLREVETKTLWQINDCKLKLSNCVNEQIGEGCYEIALEQNSHQNQGGGNQAGIDRP